MNSLRDDFTPLLPFPQQNPTTERACATLNFKLTSSPTFTAGLHYHDWYRVRIVCLGTRFVPRILLTFTANEGIIQISVAVQRRERQEWMYVWRLLGGYHNNRNTTNLMALIRKSCAHSGVTLMYFKSSEWEGGIVFCSPPSTAKGNCFLQGIRLNFLETPLKRVDYE